MATWRRVSRRPTAMEAAAITAGPVRNLTAMANVATELPQAIILGCRAINRPIHIVTSNNKSPQSDYLPKNIDYPISIPNHLLPLSVDHNPRYSPTPLVGWSIPFIARHKLLLHVNTLSHTLGVVLWFCSI